MADEVKTETATAVEKPKRASRAKPKAETVKTETPAEKVKAAVKKVETKFVRLIHPGNDLVVPDLTYTANMPLKHADVIEVPADFEHPLFVDDNGPATNVRDHSVATPGEESAPADNPEQVVQENLTTQAGAVENPPAE